MARVLLIDDDREQLEMRALIFEHHGHTVFTAESPETATTLFDSSSPDKIVMDLRLPRAEDGLALIRRFRSSAEFANNLIVILSGCPSDIEGTPEAELVDHVITKPSRSEFLLQLIDGS